MLDVCVRVHGCCSSLYSSCGSCTQLQPTCTHLHVCRISLRVFFSVCQCFQIRFILELFMSLQVKEQHSFPTNKTLITKALPKTDIYLNRYGHSYPVYNICFKLSLFNFVV